MDMNEERLLLPAVLENPVLLFHALDISHLTQAVIYILDIVGLQTAAVVIWSGHLHTKHASRTVKPALKDMRKRPHRVQFWASNGNIWHLSYALILLPFPSLSSLPLRIPPASSHYRRRSLLLLILHQLDVVLGDDRVLLQQELLNLLAHIALHHDLLAAARNLRHRGARREFLAQVLGDLLVLEREGLEACDCGDEFALPGTGRSARLIHVGCKLCLLVIGERGQVVVGVVYVGGEAGENAPYSSPLS